MLNSCKGVSLVLLVVVRDNMFREKCFKSLKAEKKNEQHRFCLIIFNTWMLTQAHTH